LPSEANRFIPVRSDADRIHTCVLEEAAGHVLIHDDLHERRDDAWTMKVSSYKKLRLSPEAAVEAARAAGFVCRIEAGPRGMVKSALMPNPSPKLTCSGLRRKHPQAA
jgi:hypothetical protein